MRLLLDTHIAVWSVFDSKFLPKEARALVIDPENKLAVSSVSLWEIAIKSTLSRRSTRGFPFSAHEAVAVFKNAGYEFLEVSAYHAAAVEKLRTIHRDPFDRLLVAQAIAEPMRLVTADQTLADYSDTVLLV